MRWGFLVWEERGEEVTPLQLMRKKHALYLSLIDLIPEYFAKKGIKAVQVPPQKPSNHLYFKTDKIGNGAIDLDKLNFEGSLEAIEDHITKVLLPKLEVMMRERNE